MLGRIRVVEAELDLPFEGPRHPVYLYSRLDKLQGDCPADVADENSSDEDVQPEAFERESRETQTGGVSNNFGLRTMKRLKSTLARDQEFQNFHNALHSRLLSLSINPPARTSSSSESVTEPGSHRIEQEKA